MTTSPLTTCRTVPVIEPTEWVLFQAEHVLAIAAWLSERGVNFELIYRGAGLPQLWRPAAIGRTTVDDGEWLGVRDGHVITRTSRPEPPEFRLLTLPFQTDQISTTEVVTLSQGERDR